MLKLRAPILNDFYVRPKVRYRVNLPLQMAECEANYVRLKKLLPQAESDQRHFAISRGQHKWLHEIVIVERSPYTTTLLLTQNQVTQAQDHIDDSNQRAASWFQMPRLTVRMYHDAELAEVLAWEGHKRLRPRYDYPNQSMYQCDEKLQINQFLGEWLMLCLNNGHEVGDVLQLFNPE